MRESATVEIFGVDDSHHVVNGPGASNRLYLATEVKGIYDAPVTTRYKSSAFQRGSTYQGKKYEQRDITFAVNLKGETPEDWEDLDSQWRSAWDFEPDPWDPASTLTKMSVTTPRSGTRSLYVALSDSIVFESKHDPHLRKSSVVPMAVTAAQPFWFEDAYENAPYDYFDTGASGTSEGFVTVYNPTDQPLFLKWVVTRGKWTLPDFSWTGKRYQRTPGGDWANRKITLPELTEVEGGARIDLDPMKLQIRDFNDTNLIGRMNGIWFMHKIPPYTPETDLPVKVELAPAGGARVEVYCPRRWSRPWGMF
ncbi:hypothetical protein [Nocardia sp. CC227C]|uniref:hypothetical protein n=1 Tax=Nocardia sp. CC227C TaxID=3044562 RepID=UPI00278C72B9|nr:hypothetical protein [Nocardia sp. CC227C]